MADDDRMIRLPPGQLREVGQYVFEHLKDDLQALLQNSARAPATVPPSVEMDQLKAALIREVKELTKNFVPSTDIDDRIDRRYADLKVENERQHAKTLHEMRKIAEAEREKARGEFYDLAEDLGVPVRTVKERGETRENIKGTLAMHNGSKEFKAEIFKQGVKWLVAWLFGLLTAILGVIGFRGGSSH